MDAAQWQRSVSTTLQRPDGLESGRRSCPAYAVHSRRPPALIFRHPFHGQGFAGKRMGQQPLQDLHLAPAAFPCCLYDTSLQPSDPTFTLGPVDLFPVCRLGSLAPSPLAPPSGEGAIAPKVTETDVDLLSYATPVVPQ